MFSSVASGWPASGQIQSHSGGDVALLSGAVSGRQQVERPSADEVDLLRKGGQPAIARALQEVQQPASKRHQAQLVLIDAASRMKIAASSVQLMPESVLLHIYDLKEGLSRVNEMLVNEILALGGVFHAGVEVFGSEWMYGACGVCNEVPRSCTGHVYNCSLVLGRTTLSKEQVVATLQGLVKDWRGPDYDILNHNCCSFAAEFCDELGVSDLPPWIDRFARLLHGGRRVTNMIRQHTNNLGAHARRMLFMRPPSIEFGEDFGGSPMVSPNAAPILLSPVRRASPSASSAISPRKLFGTKPVSVGGGAAPPLMPHKSMPQLALGLVGPYNSPPAPQAPRVPGLQLRWPPPLEGAAAFSSAVGAATVSPRIHKTLAHSSTFSSAGSSPRMHAAQQRPSASVTFPVNANMQLPLSTMARSVLTNSQLPTPMQTASTPRVFVHQHVHQAGLSPRVVILQHPAYKVSL
eukprot:TRINITY_DN53553_c0_g1_i1.p1 TRINITY_DN53553_c0_g1~~TRINITY_DN53553_c0_g1_i1.p1  ORF type:complete len:464 (+),score=68.64 TRINITY_DN53553_c0_g1_i1:106-1497(+)